MVFDIEEYKTEFFLTFYDSSTAQLNVTNYVKMVVIFK